VTDGFALRIHHLFEWLVREWDVTLVCGEGVPAPGDLEQRARIERVRIEGRWRTLPSQYNTAPLAARVAALVRERQFTAALLWGTTEWLAFDDDRFPPAVADRIDCASLSLCRQIRWERGWRKRLSDARLLASILTYERRVARRLPRVVFAGDEDARFFRRLRPAGTVHVIPNGVVAEARPDPGAEADEPTVMFTGVMGFGPNADAVIYFADAAWPQVLAAIPSARFLIVGRHPSAAVEALGRRPGITVTGAVDDMAAALRSSWVAVAPMRTGVGVKNKVLEAWAAGKPTVLTPLAINGLMIPPSTEPLVGGDGPSLANAVIHLLEDRNRRHAIGAECFSWVREHYAWARAAAGIDQLLRQIGVTEARRAG
jgi:glycosyltransferase involved in cell wall biosynthesis